VRGRTRIPIISAGRGHLHLDAALLTWQAGLEQVREMVKAIGPADVVFLAGGEPTLHPQLPEMLAALASSGSVTPGIVTDGLVLADRRLTTDLKRGGLGRVVIQIHSARALAHDFVTGRAEALRRAVAAIRTCLDLGLDVEAEITVTRPAASRLAETVALLHRLGLKQVHLHWLMPSQIAADLVLSHVARLLTQMRHVAAATELAGQLGVGLSLAGVPECLRVACGEVAPRQSAETWVVPANGNASSLRLTRHGPGRLMACDRCRGAFPSCPGVPAEYVETFGWLEIDVAVARRPR